MLMASDMRASDVRMAFRTSDVRVFIWEHSLLSRQRLARARMPAP
jgi:hypothetical protein